ncbi:MAG: hypothetical protein ABR985_22830 [Methanotrichaceae archaeon]|jgi:hypothetical protein
MTKEVYYRKLLNHVHQGSKNPYGEIVIPSKAYKRWLASGMTHVKIVYSEEENSLTVLPFGGE